MLKQPIIEKQIKHYTCGIFLFDKTNRFLVAHPTNATEDKWSIPKGYKDPEETTLAAAKREFIEETAIDIDTLNCELLFECHNIRYKDNRKALSAFFFKTDEIIDLNTCRCDSMVIKDGVDPFPENDKFAMFDWSNLELIHYTQREAVILFQQFLYKK